MKKETNTIRNKGINITKFICAIIIACIYHYKNTFKAWKLLDKNILLRVLADYGFLLVELFFIISGYLFFISYYKRIRENKIGFQSFIEKRYLRIIPISAISVVVMFILQHIYYYKFEHFWIFNNNDFVNLILQMTGIQYWMNMSEGSLNNVTWYISVLLLCYIIYYFITKKSKKYGNIIYPTIVIIFISLLKYEVDLPIINYYTERGLIAFGIGIILGLVIEKSDIKKLSNCSIIVMAFILIMTVIFKKIVLGYLVLFVDLIIFPIILINIIRFDFLLEKVNLEFTEKLSKISLGIYIWNLPLQLLFIIIVKFNNIKIDYNNIYFFIAQIIIQILFAIFSYKVIEKIINKFIDKKYILK